MWPLLARGGIIGSEAPRRHIRMVRCPAFPPALLALLLATSCTSTTIERKDAIVPRKVTELRRWQVVQGATVAGHVVELRVEEPMYAPAGAAPAAPSAFTYFRILDLHGQWVGHASDIGRFSRRVPFQEEEQDLGVWPMAQGVAQLLGLQGEPLPKLVLEPKPDAAAAEAAAPRTDR